MGKGARESDEMGKKGGGGGGGGKEESEEMRKEKGVGKGMRER